jgi:HemY protein
MAQLEQREHDDEVVSRRWLEKSVTAPVDLSWTCDSCGATVEEWSALCGNCNAFDHLVWKKPPKVLALVPRIALDQEIDEVEIIEQ